MRDEKRARELMENSKKIITMSGATICSVEKEMEEIDRKSQENLKKLSFLL